MTTSPQHANHQAIPDLDDEVRARVASCLRGAPALNCLTTDDDSGSDKEVNPLICRRKGLKSGKICTRFLLPLLTYAHRWVNVHCHQTEGESRTGSICHNPDLCFLVACFQVSSSVFTPLSYTVFTDIVQCLYYSLLWSCFTKGIYQSGCLTPSANNIS